MKRNPALAKLKANYLFPEINLRKREFLAKHPEASLISLGIGDTTEPLPPSISGALAKASAALGSSEGYSGYGPEQGQSELRQKISQILYQGKIGADEIFISDGAKCDLGRLQMLFGGHVSVAVQDPAYPVYIDGSLIQGVENILYMPCTPENQFFPDLKTLPRCDLIYFCSPNNPTGSVASKAQLEELVEYAHRNKSVLIFDSAYANYIQDPSLPKSIYEIEGAKQVAIEISSFSKLAGFTGVRLGWTIVPKELTYDDGYSIKSDWNRLISTVFNGASNIVQKGGCSVLNQQGMQEVSSLAAHYLENARLLREAFIDLGYEVYGGINAPYLWVRFPGKKSWDSFQHFLESYHLVTTPGVGFGPSGEEFVRFTAFNCRDNILKAIARLKKRT